MGHQEGFGRAAAAVKPVDAFVQVHADELPQRELIDPAVRQEGCDEGDKNPVQIFQSNFPFQMISRGAYRPNSVLTWASFSSTKSRSSLVWAAEIWVRMRALPCGTTG